MISQLRNFFAKAKWFKVSDDLEVSDWALARGQTIGAPPYDYYYLDGDSSPRLCAVDQAMHLMCASLRSDANIASLLTPASQRILVMDFYPVFDYTALPKVYIYSKSGLEQNMIVGAADNEVAISISARFELSTQTPVPDGAATVESFMDMLKRRLITDETLSVPVKADSGIVDVGVFTRRRLASENLTISVDPNDGARAIATREMVVVGLLTIDKASRRIANLAAAIP